MFRINNSLYKSHFLHSTFIIQLHTRHCAILRPHDDRLLHRLYPTPQQVVIKVTWSKSPVGVTSQRRDKEQALMVLWRIYIYIYLYIYIYIYYIYIYIYIFIREYEEILFLADLWRLSGEKWSSIWLMDRCPFYTFWWGPISSFPGIVPEDDVLLAPKWRQKLAPKWCSSDCY